MSLKNDIEMVKEELNSEEKFFEKAVMTEKFVKKYKYLMIGAFAAVVIVIGGSMAYDINKSSTVTAANESLVTLEANPSDTMALSSLKSLSPALHDVWVYSQAIANKDMQVLKTLEQSKAPILKDLVSYELAAELKDTTALNTYASNQSAIYRDLAQVQSAVVLLNEGKIDLAHSKLSTINEQSSLYKVAKALQHYGVK